VAALAADQPEALALAAGTVVGKRDLEGRIGRLGAGIGEEDARVALGRNLRKPLGELEGDRVAHLERGREIELRRLLADRLDDPRPAVAGVDAPEAGLAIEDLAALRGPVVHPLGRAAQAMRLLALPFGRRGQPEGGTLEPGPGRTGEIGVGALVHAPSLRSAAVADHLLPLLPQALDAQGHHVSRVEED